MGRPRTVTKKHLPPYVRQKNNRYYLEPKGELKKLLCGKSSIALGASYPQMLSKYAALVKKEESAQVAARDITTMAGLIDEFMLVIRPLEVEQGRISPLTYHKELGKSKFLRSAFGELPPAEIRKVDIYQYIDWRSANGASIGVNREIALLGRILQHGERVGLLDVSPCINIRRNPETGKTRYITDQEYMQFRTFVAERNPLVAAYIDFKYVSGLRVGDILTLTKGKLRTDGLDCYISKNKQHKIMEWSPTLRAVTENLMASNWKPAAANKSAPSSIYLMHNRKGQPYTTDGWRAIFYRLMRKACEQGILGEPFCDHDIRAKAGSDAKSVEEAAKFLVHLNIRVTQKHYRRKPEYIQPLL